MSEIHLVKSSLLKTATPNMPITKTTPATIPITGVVSLSPFDVCKFVLVLGVFSSGF